LTEKKTRKKKTLKDLKKILPSQPSQTVAPSPKLVPKPGFEANPVSFEKEMERLGVIPHKAQDGTELSTDLPEEEPALDEKPIALVGKNLDDEELFLSSLKNFDTIFEEEDHGAPSESFSTRRTRTLRKKKFIPETQIDLHGLTRQEALRKVHFFLENASYEGLKKVLIITGCGHGSEGEAVLRSAVEDFLAKEAQLWVSSWERAPRKFGGEGAIAVSLRRKPG
jgi:DNA-nicking Smr family endonuclease